jgi:hypothetical protein
MIEEEDQISAQILVLIALLLGYSNLDQAPTSLSPARSLATKKLSLHSFNQSKSI